MFGLFDLFLPKFNTDPITIKEVQDLDRKYQGFIFDDGSNFFSQFNTQKLERRVRIDDFYDTILRFEDDFPTIDISLNKNNIKSKIDYSVVWDNDDEKT